MKRNHTKQRAEDALRELPSVLGAFVQEDVNGNPREVHLLVRPGPSLRHLARDVKDLLEERLGVTVDQRVISIAQIADGGGLSVVTAGGAPAAEAIPPVSEVATEEALPSESAPERAEQVRETSAAAPLGTDLSRPAIESIESSLRGGRITVRLRLGREGAEFAGEAVELEARQGRARAGALAALRAASQAAAGGVRFDLEAASVARVLEQDYALVAALALSPDLGRRPLNLFGAHPVESDVETAAALAALKAVNRILTRGSS